MNPLPLDGFDEVTSDLVRLTHLVGSAMHTATQALLESDLHKAESVIDEDADVDAVTSDIESQCLELLGQGGLTEPDLRVVIGALRMAASLERMGDLAEHVAKQARLRYPRSSIPAELQPIFATMGELAEEIVTMTGQVIQTRDVSLTADIARHDTQVDQLHRDLFTTVLSPAWTHGVEAAIDVTLLSRYYERYADHAVSVTRRVVTIVTGAPYVGVSLDEL